MPQRPTGRRTPPQARRPARSRCAACRSSASTFIERVIHGETGEVIVTCRKCGRTWTSVDRKLFKR